MGWREWASGVPAAWVQQAKGTGLVACLLAEQSGECGGGARIGGAGAREEVDQHPHAAPLHPCQPPPTLGSGSNGEKLGLGSGSA